MQNDVPNSSQPTSPTRASSFMPGHHVSGSIASIFEPAVEGPPSSERIRELSNKLKQASTAERHIRYLTASSGSSSRLSTISDGRPSWDRSLESLSLSRKSSQRSASSSAASRDRPESVQVFGKPFFNRRSKLRREKSDQGPSISSLRSSFEDLADSNAFNLKDQPFIQAMFTRRRREDSETSPKRLPISGPYDFQHVTHTRKNDLPNLTRANRMDLVNEFSGMRSRRTTETAMSDNMSAGLHIIDSSSDAIYTHEENPVGLDADRHVDITPRSQLTLAQSRDKLLPPSPPAPSIPPRSPKRSLSEQTVTISPPRQSRSAGSSPFASPIPPPPRTSSRVSTRYDGHRILSTTTLERPSTSGSLRSPQPFVPPSPKRYQGLRPPPASHVSGVKVNHSTKAEFDSFHRALPVNKENSWPLPNKVSSLPEVPEEEEDYVMRRKSRLSVASNSSSLRGSVSVPLLRQLSFHQAAQQRPPSNASDTLGKVDQFAVRKASDADSDDTVAGGDTSDNWEDDIDYCYDHAAEADCDFAWERPSCDIQRKDDDGYGDDDDYDDDASASYTYLGFGLSTASSSVVSSQYLAPEVADLPALSPASQTSHSTQHEAITPTSVPIPAASNFSLPRRDSSALLQRDVSRAHSRPTSFKEVQGFTISPSLLIPPDYHQQMLRYEREENDLDNSRASSFSFSEDRHLKPASQDRSSSSTTDSALSEQSGTSTAFTRWTGSSASSLQQAHGDHQQPVVPPMLESFEDVDDFDDLDDEEELDYHRAVSQLHKSSAPVSESKKPPAALPTIKTSKKNLTLREGQLHNRTQSDANLLFRTTHSTTKLSEVDENTHAREPLKTRRRARTTSRSHNNPAPSFALFPQVARNNGAPF